MHYNSGVLNPAPGLGVMWIGESPLKEPVIFVIWSWVHISFLETYAILLLLTIGHNLVDSKQLMAYIGFIVGKY